MDLTVTARLHALEDLPRFIATGDWEVVARGLEFDQAEQTLSRLMRVDEVSADVVDDYIEAYQQALVEAHQDLADALWAGQPLTHNPETQSLAESVLEWLSVGLRSDEAIHWVEAGFFDPETAASAAKAGLTPTEATAALTALPASAFQSPVSDTQSRITAACNGDVELPW